jgi:hypothetical protein
MIKRFIQIGLLSLVLVPMSSRAADIECVGKATQVVNKNDTLFIFKDEIHLRSTRGDVDWYKSDGTLIASNTDEVYPDEGGIYTDLAGDLSSPCYVFLYSDPVGLTLDVTPDCEATTLTLAGDTKAFSYTRPDGTTGTYTRACTILYNALSWNNEAWVDSAAQYEASLKAGNIILPAL